MNNLQFDFNPITPVPSSDGGGNFPWLMLIAVGIFVMMIVYSFSKKGEQLETPNRRKNQQL